MGRLSSGVSYQMIEKTEDNIGLMFFESKHQDRDRVDERGRHTHPTCLTLRAHKRIQGCI